MKKLFSLSALFLFCFLSPSAFAQAEGSISAEGMLIAIVALLVFTLLVLSAVIFSMMSLQKALKRDRREKLRAQGVEVEEEVSWLSQLNSKLWAIKPMKEESTILLDHDYDGIRELDNHLPPWWKYFFYFTIAFGIVYLIDRHVLHISPTQHEEYEAQLAVAAEEAAIRQAAISEAGGVAEVEIVFTDDAAALAEGKKTYDRQCAACHRPDGGGSIGPNLTDEYWLHGGSMADIYNTVKVGVPDKGMISWESTLSPTQIRDVSSYIMTLAGSNPESPKAPQGEKYEPTAE